MFKNIKGLADSNIRNNDMIHVVLNLLTSSQTCIQSFSLERQSQGKGTSYNFV